MAAKVSKKNELLLILPSDHLIANVNEFIKMLENSFCKANHKDWFLYGVKPTNPSTSFGYIELLKNENVTGLYKISKFIEKPNLDVANKLFQSENYLWNSGIFLVKNDVAISSIKKYATDIALECDRAFNHISSDFKNNIIRFDHDLFSKIRSESIDYSVLENINNIMCFLLDTAWNDAGSWDEVFKIENLDKTKGKSYQINGANNIFSHEGRTIATVGVKDLMIVDTKDKTLITRENNSLQLKKLLKNMLEDKSRLNIDYYERRPWGQFEILHESEFFKVKILEIFPKKRISLQYHNKRSEHWIIVSGEATVHLNGKEIKLKESNSIDIPKTSVHFIANQTTKQLVVVEVMMGEYFGEDDIVRLEDSYGRK